MTTPQKYPCTPRSVVSMLARETLRGRQVRTEIRVDKVGYPINLKTSMGYLRNLTKEEHFNIDMISDPANPQAYDTADILRHLYDKLPRVWGLVHIFFCAGLNGPLVLIKPNTCYKEIHQLARNAPYWSLCCRVGEPTVTLEEHPPKNTLLYKPASIRKSAPPPNIHKPLSDLPREAVLLSSSSTHLNRCSPYLVPASRNPLPNPSKPSVDPSPSPMLHVPTTAQLSTNIMVESPYKSNPTVDPSVHHDIIKEHLVPTQCVDHRNLNHGKEISIAIHPQKKCMNDIYQICAELKITVADKELDNPHLSLNNSPDASTVHCDTLMQLRSAEKSSSFIKKINSIPRMRKHTGLNSEFNLKNLNKISGIKNHSKEVSEKCPLELELEKDIQKWKIDIDSYKNRQGCSMLLEGFNKLIQEAEKKRQDLEVERYLKNKERLKPYNKKIPKTSVLLPHPIVPHKTSNNNRKTKYTDRNALSPPKLS